MPAVVVPASSAHFEGGELLLYAMARKGCTIWHRLARRPFFLRRGVAAMACCCQRVAMACSAPPPRRRRDDVADAVDASRRWRVLRHSTPSTPIAARTPSTQAPAKLDPSTSRARRCAYRVVRRQRLHSSEGRAFESTTTRRTRRPATSTTRPTRTPRPYIQGGSSRCGPLKRKGNGSPRARTASKARGPAAARRASVASTTGARTARRRSGNGRGRRRRRATPRCSSNGRRRLPSGRRTRRRASPRSATSCTSGRRRRASTSRWAARRPI